MLDNIKSSDNVLLALADSASAISTKNILTMLENDFRKITCYASYAHLHNCSTSTVSNKGTSKSTFKVGKFAIIKVGTEYKKLEITSSNLDIENNILDTTAVTSGAIPTEIYILPSIYTNNIRHILNDEKTKYFTEQDGKVINCHIHYNELTIPFTRELLTKVELEIKDDQLDYMLFNNARTELISATAVLTSSSTEIISHSSNITDPYKVFDGNTTESAYSIACADDGTVEIFHTYDFTDPVQIMKIKVFCNLAKNSPQKIILSGSTDNSTFVDLITLEQDIVIDNYIIDKRLEISKYANYRYYKVSVLKGPNSDNVSVNEYILLKEQ